MFERRITEEEVIHAISFGTLVKEDEDAIPFPKEEISCRVGLRLIYVVVAVNHTTKTEVVVTVYAKGKRK
jgi:hypothetical protein